MKNHLVIHWIITNFPMNNSQCDIIREHDSIIISDCQNLKVGEWSKELVSWAYCPTLWIKAEHVWHAPENVCRASIPISSLRIFSVLSPSSLWTFECIPFLACLPLSLVDDAEELSQSRGILSVQRYLSQGGLLFPPTHRELQPSFSTQYHGQGWGNTWGNNWRHAHSTRKQ